MCNSFKWFDGRMKKPHCEKFHAHTHTLYDHEIVSRGAVSLRYISREDEGVP